MRFAAIPLVVLALLLPLSASGQTCATDTCSTCGAPASGTDVDNDGIPDRLEYDLAYQFFPSVKLQWLSGDLGEAYPYLSRSIPYTVQPVAANGTCDEDKECLEIRYGIAFRNDAGDDVFGGGHLGDSEIYAAMVVRTVAWSTASTSTAYWTMMRDFSSAHWGTSGESSKVGAYGDCPCSSYSDTACQAHSFTCQFYGGFCGGVPSDPKYPSCDFITNSAQCWYAGCSWNPPICVNRRLGCYSSSRLAGSVVLYASEGKHGLYHTDGECESGGAFGADACPTNQYDYRSYISGRLQNVGNVSCNTQLDTTIQHPDFCNLYGVWSGAGFGQSTAYRTHFLAAIDWALPSATQTNSGPVAPVSCTQPPSTGCPTCGEASCSPVQAAYISHFTGAGCTGTEYYYTPYFGSDGIRRSWNGTGCAGNQMQTVTNRSYRDSSGACYDAWPSGNTLSGFVRIYR